MEKCVLQHKREAETLKIHGCTVRRLRLCFESFKGRRFEDSRKPRATGAKTKRHSQRRFESDPKLDSSVCGFKLGKYTRGEINNDKI